MESKAQVLERWSLGSLLRAVLWWEKGNVGEPGYQERV